MRRITTALSITTLALTLASCGQMPTAPSTGAPSGELVQVRLGAIAPASVQGLGQKTLGAQGLPAGASLAHIKVTVRDSSNNPVYFVGGTYAPDGASRPDATSTLVLDATTGWGKTVLLPKGQYSFENAGKYEDSTQNVLLSYGPASENTATLDDKTNVVQLKFHGVIDPMKSRLDFAMQTSTIYTNDEVHLKLYANTAEVNGQSFPLPLSDIFMGGVLQRMPDNYTLADYNSAEFMGPGSARGVDLIARGTPENPNLSVTPHFRAYVRQGNADVAQLQPIELPAFEHAIETQAIVADVKRPYDVTMNPVEAPAAGQLVSLSGVALDEHGVTRIDVYEGSTLVASSAQYEAPNSVTTDENGAWTAPWLARTGTHQLTVVARDAAGNESEASQTVTVAAKTNQIGVLYGASNLTYLKLQPGETAWVNVDYTNLSYSSYEMYVDYYTYAYPENGQYSESTVYLDMDLYSAREGTLLPAGMWDDNMWFGGRTSVTLNNAPSRVFWAKVTNTNAFPVTFEMYAGSLAD
jgi:hypothetical protein